MMSHQALVAWHFGDSAVLKVHIPVEEIHCSEPQECNNLSAANSTTWPRLPIIFISSSSEI